MTNKCTKVAPAGIPLGSLLASLARLWARLGLNWSYVWLTFASPWSSLFYVFWPNPRNWPKINSKWTQHVFTITPKWIPKITPKSIKTDLEPICVALKKRWFPRSLFYCFFYILEAPQPCKSSQNTILSFKIEGPIFHEKAVNFTKSNQKWPPWDHQKLTKNRTNMKKGRLENGTQKNTEKHAK